MTDLARDAYYEALITSLQTTTNKAFGCAVEVTRVVPHPEIIEDYDDPVFSFRLVNRLRGIAVEIFCGTWAQSICWLREGRAIQHP